MAAGLLLEGVRSCCFSFLSFLPFLVLSCAVLVCPCGASAQPFLLFAMLLVGLSGGVVRPRRASAHLSSPLLELSLGVGCGRWVVTFSSSLLPSCRVASLLVPLPGHTKTRVAKKCFAHSENRLGHQQQPPIPNAVHSPRDPASVHASSH